jgi:serine/threonine protein kinase
MEERPFVEMEDKKVKVDLSVLASVTFVPPQFRPTADFTIKSLLYHGDLSSLFSGTLEGRPVVIETCSRVPFRLVCRELKLLSELAHPGIVKVVGVCRKPTLGVVNIAYADMDFVPWPEPIPWGHVPRLLLALMRTVDHIHQKNIFHSWICRSSVYISRDLDSVKLGAFHAACRIGELCPLVPLHSCAPVERIAEADRRPDDVYSAGMWCVSLFGGVDDWESAEVDQRFRKIVEKMIVEDPAARITAGAACQKLEKLLGNDFGAIP